MPSHFFCMLIIIKLAVSFYVDFLSFTCSRQQAHYGEGMVFPTVICKYYEGPLGLSLAQVGEVALRRLNKNWQRLDKKWMRYHW